MAELVVAQGGTITLEGYYARGDTGAPADPVTPLVDILNPDGDQVVADDVPIRLAEGHYAYTYSPAADATPGLWSIHWSGVITGLAVQATEPFLVVPAGSIDAAGYYGATVRGVLDYVPELRLDPADPETARTVVTFLDFVGPLVSAAIGARLRALQVLADAGVTEAGDVVSQVALTARGLTQMGAASLTQDSRYPEIARADATDQAWGAALWARFQSALADMVTSLDAELERLGADTIVDEVQVEADRPAVSAPPATFHDRMRF